MVAAVVMGHIIQYTPLSSILRNLIFLIEVLLAEENLIFIGHIFFVELKAKGTDSGKIQIGYCSISAFPTTAL